LEDVVDGRRTLQGRSHAVAVVLDEIHHGQLPQAGHVQRLVERTRVHHRFTHVAQANLVATAVLDYECNAGCERNMAAHDSMSAKEVDLLVEQVPGATVAAHYSILAAEQLGHDTARAHAPCESRTVIAVGGDHVVVRPQHCKRAGGYSFLPVIQVAETTDLAQCVRLGRALLEATLQK